MSDTPMTDAEEQKQRDEYMESREIDWPAFPADFDFARKLERELTAAQIGAARYEYLRKLHPSDYSKLYKDCLFQDLNFDAEVDRRRMKP